jgi:hypothetical protein
MKKTMPATIVTETRWVEPVATCPAPECNLSEAEIEQVRLPYLALLMIATMKPNPAFLAVQPS